MPDVDTAGKIFDELETLKRAGLRGEGITLDCYIGEGEALFDPMSSSSTTF